jgi:hypothetical protein
MMMDTDLPTQTDQRLREAGIGWEQLAPVRRWNRAAFAAAGLPDPHSTSYEIPEPGSV